MPEYLFLLFSELLPQSLLIDLVPRGAEVGGAVKLGSSSGLLGPKKDATVATVAVLAIAWDLFEVEHGAVLGCLEANGS